jgi:hypothetical protein
MNKKLKTQKKKEDENGKKRLAILELNGSNNSKQS